MEQAQQAANGRPTKLQLAKITVSGECQLAKLLTPPHLFEDRKPKIYHNVPNKHPQETDQGFFEILPVLRQVRL